MAKPTNAEIIEALRDTMGIITAAARKLCNDRRKITRSGLSKRISRTPELQTALEDAEASACDYAESTLLKAMKDGNVKAAMFYLEHRSAKYRAVIENPSPRAIRTVAEIEAEMASLGFVKKTGEIEFTNEPETK